MPFSQYLGDAILNWVRDNADFPARPADVYVALWNGNPTADGSGGTELTNTITGSTTRTTSQALGTVSTSGSYRQTTTSTQIQITASASGAATATYITLWDAATAGAGNLLYFESITSTDIAAGAEVNIDAGNLTVRSKIA